jgi:acetyl esterase/lipase
VNLDPEIAAFLDAVPPGTFDFGAWELEDIPTRRAARAAATPAPVLPPTTTVHHDLHEPVGMRLSMPPGDGRDRPCLLWIHGGGYFLGSGFAPDARLDRWVEELGCVVVSVDYRLAPEHPYPAALDDCWTALLWTFEQAGELGIDPGRVAIGGASAGGGLAAALALLARERGEDRIAAQVLVYPMLDDREAALTPGLDAGHVWDRAATRLGWRAYLGGLDGIPVTAAPARATDLAGLPPAFVGVGALDLFRDECIAYAARLLRAGVPTELHVYAGAPHGFDVLTRSAVGDRFDRELTDAVRQSLSPRRGIVSAAP